MALYGFVLLSLIIWIQFWLHRNSQYMPLNETKGFFFVVNCLHFSSNFEAIFGLRK